MSNPHGETPPETPPEGETPPADPTGAEGDPPAETPPEDETPPEGDTFPRAYVEQLRGKQQRYRKRAQDAETRAGELSAALWTSQVAKLDKLADPADLPFPDDGDPLDADTVAEAVDELLAAKPHLAARRARGDIGQHTPRGRDDTVNLAGMLRANT